MCGAAVHVWIFMLICTKSENFSNDKYASTKCTRTQLCGEKFQQNSQSFENEPNLNRRLKKKHTHTIKLSIKYTI